MKIFKAKVAVGSSIYNVDAIYYQGKLWLVPHWLDKPATAQTTPARIIRFDNLRYSDLRGTDLGDFVLNDPMPKELFEIETPKQPISGFEYIDMPAIVRGDDDQLN